MKAYSKAQLAQFAGVSATTFRRWLKNDADYLKTQGIAPTTKLFPPQVVQYLAQKYDIDLPE